MTIDYRPQTRPLGHLTPRQERFVREYAASGNAKRSALLAGYSVGSAKQVGSKLLKNLRIQTALKSLGGISSTVPKTGLTQAWAIGQLLEETADPNPKIRLAAKKAILQALTAIGADVGVFECAKCAQELAVLKAMSSDERVLRRLEMTFEELGTMSQAQFGEWERQRQDALLEDFKAAFHIWVRVSGV